MAKVLREFLMEEQKFIDRDLSWLSFNYRVLMEAADPDVPIFERLRFLGIYSSNLDEFFRVRVAAMRSVVDIDKKKINKRFEREPRLILDEILNEVNRQQDEFGKIKKNQVLPELKKNGITIYRDEPILKEHKDFITHFFKSKILSYLQPVIISGSQAEPPFLENRALYLIALLKRIGQEKECYGKVKIPTDHLDRFVQLPTVEGQFYFIAIDDIIRENMDFIFSGYNTIDSYSIKLNRDADLNIEDEYSGDLVKKIRKQIKKRNLGVPSRFLYDSRMPSKMVKFLAEQYNLKEEDLVAGGVYHNMHDLMDLENPLKPELEYDPQPPLVSSSFDEYTSVFEAIKKKDVLLHFPYQSYDYVLRFFNEAALDPNVKEIYVTFYRIADESFISNALISAARNGKKVTVFIEIKARFDEANNLKWADRMEEEGINIIYTIPGLKVHAKVALVIRDENGISSSFGYYGTGNFNEKTAKIYSDLALFTADKKMNKELLQLFDYLKEKDNEEEEVEYEFNELMIAQFNLQEKFVELIDREIEHAKNGREAHMIIKLNNLEDEKMINKLYEASEAGVKIDLIIRAICCLVPGDESFNKNITVRRIVDRYLEHTRIYYFKNGGNEEFYSGSADWMKRNLYRRIEVVFPVLDEQLIEELRIFVQMQLSDNVKACYLNSRLENVRMTANGSAKRVQVDFYKRIKEKVESPAHS